MLRVQTGVARQPNVVVHTGSVNVLVVGGSGLVGSAVMHEARSRSHIAVAACRRPPSDGVALDLTNADQVGNVIATVAPDVVVNAAYAKAPPGLEPVTVIGAAVCAMWAQRLALGYVHLSTDVVFADSPQWRRTQDTPNPIGAYGTAKARAERMVRAAHPGAAIVRTSLVCADVTLLDAPGAGPQGHLVASALAEPSRVQFFDDEIRTPILVSDLATAVVDIATERARSDSTGSALWHVSGPEAMSRFELARRLAARGGADPSALRSVSSGAGSSGVPPASDRARVVMLDSSEFVERFGFRPRPISRVSDVGGTGPHGRPTPAVCSLRGDERL